MTPITFALKTILQKAFLNDPYKGGLSSYGVVLLIIHFLSVQIKRGNDVSMKNLGKLRRRKGRTMLKIMGKILRKTMIIY